jgi:hypothetical protein
VESIESKQYFAGPKLRSALTNTNTYKRLLNYVAGPILFVLIGISIYNQVAAQPQLGKQWQQLLNRWQQHPGLLIASLALMMANWGLEARKWQLLVSHALPASYRRALMGVLAGVSFTMLTPNRTGEFLGRVLSLPDGSRIRAATLTAFSSMSQLVVTLSAGIAGMAYLQHYYHGTPSWQPILAYALLYGSAMALLLLLAVYFNVAALVRLLHKWPPIGKYTSYLQAVGELQAPELLRYLVLSALRYAVFLWQYYLIFALCGVQLTIWQAAAGTASLFLILAVVPSVSLAELGIRGKASLFVFGLLGGSDLGILAATGLIWLINIILPAAAGSLILLSVKLFNKTSFNQP